MGALGLSLFIVCFMYLIGKFTIANACITYIVVYAVGLLVAIIKAAVDAKEES